MYQILCKKFRHRKRMRQKELAKRSGVSESYISHLEAEERDRTPTLQILESLAQSLNICVNDIIIYPCIECPQNQTCTHCKKDMREVEEIIEEILDYYI